MTCGTEITTWESFRLMTGSVKVVSQSPKLDAPSAGPDAVAGPESSLKKQPPRARRESDRRERVKMVRMSVVS